MGIVREPIGVDFEFVPKKLTKREKEKINKIIEDFKKKQSVKESTPKQKKKPKSKK
jgi:hypothetical protein